MEFDGSVRIKRSPHEVFIFLADVQDHTGEPGSPVLSMEKEPTGETQVGTRWREVVRLGPFTRMTVHSEVVALEADRKLELSFKGPGMRGSLTYLVEEPGVDECTLHQIESIHLVGILRPFSPLYERLLRPRLEGRMQDIRDDLEHGPAAPAPGEPAGTEASSEESD